jgi:hypothetical protein
MDSRKIIRVLKIILVACLLAFVINVTKYKTNDCQLCSFEIDGEYFRIGSFMDYYFDECLSNKEMPLMIDIEYINQYGGVINE